MRNIFKLKPTFKLTTSEINRATMNWQMQSTDYQKNIRLGQHYCNFFKLCRSEGANNIAAKAVSETHSQSEHKTFEEVLWQTNDPVDVLELLSLVIDWEN